MSDIKTIFTDLSTGAQYDIGALGITEDDSLTTAVIVSLFTDKRDTTINSDDARGWWADDIGSLRWTLSRSKQTDEILQKLIKYDTQALQWLIDERLVSSVNITAQWISRGVLTEQINITLNNGQQLVFSVEESR
jgi:phage gp46-like protein